MPSIVVYPRPSASSAVRPLIFYFLLSPSAPLATTWTITNAGWAGTFSYDGLGNIHLNLSEVPEPSTWIGAALALLAVGWMTRKRFIKKAETLKA